MYEIRTARIESKTGKNLMEQWLNRVDQDTRLIAEYADENEAQNAFWAYVAENGKAYKSGNLYIGIYVELVNSEDDSSYDCACLDYIDSDDIHEYPFVVACGAQMLDGRKTLAEARKLVAQCQREDEKEDGQALRYDIYFCPSLSLFRASEFRSDNVMLIERNA